MSTIEAKIRIASLLPDHYSVNPKPVDLGVLLCNGGKLLPEGAVVAFPVYASQPTGLYLRPKFEAGVAVTLPGRWQETTLIETSEKKFNDNVIQAAQAALTAACDHAGCNGGKNCILKQNIHSK